MQSCKIQPGHSGGERWRTAPDGTGWEGYILLILEFMKKQTTAAFYSAEGALNSYETYRCAKHSGSHEKYLFFMGKSYYTGSGGSRFRDRRGPCPALAGAGQRGRGTGEVFSFDPTGSSPAEARFGPQGTAPVQDPFATEGVTSIVNEPEKSQMIFQAGFARRVQSTQ